jgi:hypothetical protein
MTDRTVLGAIAAVISVPVLFALFGAGPEAGIGIGVVLVAIGLGTGLAGSRRSGRD